MYWKNTLKKWEYNLTFWEGIILKKLLSLFIVLALMTTFAMAETTSTMPDVKLGTISTEESASDTTAVNTQIPEQLKAVRIFENGEDTGFAIEMRDVEAQYGDYEEAYASQQQNFNPVFDGVFLKFDIANYKAEAKLLDMYAIKNNVTVDALNLEEETNNIVAEISANEQYKQQVITNYGSMEAFYQFVKMVKREEMQRQVVLDIVAPLTDTAIEEEFVKQQSDLVLKYEQAKAKHILVETLEEAEKIKADIEAGNKTFEEAANEFTIDPGNKGNGGELGWIPRGRTVPEFEVAVFTAEIGKITNPVKSQYGYHIVLVEDKKPLRGISDFRKMEEEYSTFTEQVQQTTLTRWFKEYMSENNITFEYNDYLRSIKKFGELYTETSQTGDYAPMISFVVNFKPVSFNDRAFYEVAIQSILQVADQMPGTVSEEQRATIDADRLENLKTMSTDKDNGFAALSRYYALNPSDTRMAMKFFDKFISEALVVAQDADFMTAYGDQVITQLMQAYPGLQAIGEDATADSRDRVVAYIYMIRINKITDDTVANKELADKILELDPSNEEVLKLIED
jgi:parvulin-like peptidyl-prolyl isomerase